MSIATVSTRDQARVLVNTVNKIFGRKVLKQPAKKGLTGWSPTFWKGTIKLSLSRQPTIKSRDTIATNPSGSSVVVTTKRSFKRPNTVEA